MLSFIFAKILFVPVSSLKREKLDFSLAIPAMKFIDKWSSGNKLLVNIILPSDSLFSAKDVVELTKMITNEFEIVPYFLFDFNIIEHKSFGSGAQELYWFPFSLNSYNRQIYCSDFIFPNETQQKYVLFYSGRETLVENIFRSCPLRFDSNVVHYFNGSSEVFANSLIFEEIFKIHERDKNLKKIVLAKVAPESQELQLKGLKSYIWKRRNDLYGANFKTIVNIMYPFITGVSTSKNKNGESVFHSAGFYPDLLQYLMTRLNFTLTNNLLQKQDDYKSLVNSVINEHYDIGIALLRHDRKRKDLVDFSFATGSSTLSLYYVENYKKPNYFAFRNSFQSEAWFVLLLYVLILIFGYVSLIYMVEKQHKTYSSFLIFGYFQKAANFILRSIIGKRIHSEPDRMSAKIAFFVLTFIGFIFITLYRAMLVAFVAVDIQTPPVSSFEDIQSSNYRLAVQSNTAIERIFLHAKAGSVEEKINNSGKLLRFDTGLKVFLDEMTSDEKTHGNVILFHHHEEAKFSEHHPCKLLKIPNYENENSRTGMIFRKNWPFTRLLNHNLLMMKEKGIMHQYLYPYERGTDQLCENEVKIRSVLHVPHPVSLYTTVFLFLIISGGFLCSLGILLMELRHC